MQLEKPLLFTEHNFGNEKPKYKWYEGINIKFMEMRNDKLFNQLIKLNCKAATGITIAACEWVLWRLESWREKRMDFNIALLKGDGIGPEIIKQALHVRLVSIVNAAKYHAAIAEEHLCEHEARIEH